MPRYAFDAKGPSGQDMRGEFDAANEAEARVKLRAQRLTPVRLTVVNGGGAKPKSTGGRIKSKDLQIFTRQLATLLGSGIPILQSIDVLGKSSRTPALNAALMDVVSQVSQGKRFADALGNHPKTFDRFYVNMVRAGEESGNLDKVLQRLATYIEKSVKIQGKVKGAMIYPAVIMCVAGVVVSALLIFVIPKFQDLFKGSGQELPGLTKMVVSLSQVFIKYWWAIIGGTAASVFGLLSFYRSDEGKKVFDTVLIDVPLMGTLIQKSGVARFTRTLSTLLESGVGIMEAIEIAARTSGNNVIELALMRSKEAISEGKSIITPLAKEKYIPPMVVQMIGVGEQTGNLDQMLAKIADFYEDEVDVAVGALTSVMEPLLMVFLGAIIAVIVIAMYLPIFNLANAVGG